MKSFNYKFTTVKKGLLIAGLALSVAGFGINLFFLITNGISSAADPVYPILQYTLMFLVTVALFTLIISMLISSKYIIDDKFFKIKFGLIVSKYELEKIDSVVLDRKTDKLNVTFDNGEYAVIVVKQDWYNDFIEALLAANPKIEYSIISLDNNDVDKK